MTQYLSQFKGSHNKILMLFDVRMTNTYRNSSNFFFFLNMQEKKSLRLSYEGKSSLRMKPF